MSDHTHDPKQPSENPGGPDVAVVHVNGKPVSLPGEEATGLEIKEHAIKAGVAIQLDFVLSLEIGHGKTEIIGDHQRVGVNDGTRFVALAPDDNS